MIPIIAIIAVAVIICLKLFLNFKKRREMFTLYHQERMAAIDKGIELPPLAEGFFGETIKPKGSPRRCLLAGMVWLFVGLALLIMFKLNSQQNEACLLGLVPTGIGLAYLIYYFVAGRKEAEAMEKKTAPPVIQQH